MTDCKMDWNPPKFKILGLWFTNDLVGMTEINMKDKFNEAKKLFSIWSKRISTPIGRVAILKSLILSKLIYLWILLPNPPDNFVDLIQKKCFNFVWEKKNDKIKRTIAIHNIENGGLGISHIKTYITALKLTWITKIIKKQDTKWTIILKHYCPNIEKMNQFGGTFVNGININSFWKDVFKAYEELWVKQVSCTPEDFLSEPLFHNANILIDDKPVFLKDWYSHVILIKDLFCVVMEVS